MPNLSKIPLIIINRACFESENIKEAAQRLDVQPMSLQRFLTRIHSDFKQEKATSYSDALEIYGDKTLNDFQTTTPSKSDNTSNFSTPTDKRRANKSFLSDKTSVILEEETGKIICNANLNTLRTIIGDLRSDPINPFTYLILKKGNDFYFVENNGAISIDDRRAAFLRVINLSSLSGVIREVEPVNIEFNSMETEFSPAEEKLYQEIFENTADLRANNRETETIIDSLLTSDLGLFKKRTQDLDASTESNEEPTNNKKSKNS